METPDAAGLPQAHKGEHPMAKILNSIVEATGQTPLVKLNRLDEGLPVT